MEVGAVEKAGAVEGAEETEETGEAGEAEKALNS
jgi:hypothetical protein